MLLNIYLLIAVISITLLTLALLVYTFNRKPMTAILLLLLSVIFLVITAFSSFHIEEVECQNLLNHTSAQIVEANDGPPDFTPTFNYTETNYTSNIVCRMHSTNASELGVLFSCLIIFALVMVIVYVIFGDKEGKNISF